MKYYEVVLIYPLGNRNHETTHWLSIECQQFPQKRNYLVLLRNQSIKNWPDSSSGDQEFMYDLRWFDQSAGRISHDPKVSCLLLTVLVKGSAETERLWSFFMWWRPGLSQTSLTPHHLPEHFLFTFYIRALVWLFFYDPDKVDQPSFFLFLCLSLSPAVLQ